MHLKRSFRRGVSRALVGYLREVFGYLAGLFDGWTRETLIQACMLLVVALYCAATFGLWSSTQQALNLARDQMRDAGRAWITVADVVLAEPLAANRPVRIAVTMKNTGQSPALHASVSGSLVIRDLDPPFGNPSPGRNRKLTDMGVGEVRDADVDWTSISQLQTADLAALDSGRQRLYATVEISYSDVFQRANSTRVCVVYRPLKKDLIACETGNELH